MNGFDLFWETYPHKVSKGQAVKAWDKISPDEELEKKILLALSAQKKYRGEAKSTGEFVPPWKYPATWLNGQCWLDEIPSHGALKEKQNAQIEVCKCGRKATQQEGLCARCWTDKHAPAQRGSSSEIPRRDGESPLDYIRRTLGKGKGPSMGKPKAEIPGPDEFPEGPFEYGPEDEWNHG